MSFRLSSLPGSADAVFVSRVDVDVDAVGFPTGVVDVVAAHGQVASPSMRVKKSHLTDFYGVAQTRYMLLPWMCMYGRSCILCYMDT